MASDLFAWGGNDYSICTDYYSSFFEIDVLGETTSGEVIAKLKNSCARYGIPGTRVSDNGSQYSSTSFRAFLKNGIFINGSSTPVKAKLMVQLKWL